MPIAMTMPARAQSQPARLDRGSTAASAGVAGMEGAPDAVDALDAVLADADAEGSVASGVLPSRRAGAGPS
jgi:hypothetical protein